MQFRITSCLILGLTVAALGGCSCGDGCRLPRIHRFYEGMAARIGVQEGVMLDQNSNCQACHAGFDYEGNETSQPVSEPDAPNPPPQEFEDEQPAPQDLSVSEQTTRRLKAIPISTSKNVSEPPVLEAEHSESTGVNEEDSIEFRGEDLPASSSEANVDAPIVLQAVPSENHRIIDRRIADRRGVGEPGYPTTDNVAFRNLPELNDHGKSDGQSGVSTSGDPIEPGSDGFTKPTSHQVPGDNRESMLLNAMSAINGGVVDKVSVQQFANQETQADWMTNDSRVRIVDGKPVVEQIRILRLRATTPIDREHHVPPIVSIKSTMEPIIVRSIHPDVNKPVVNLESTDPKIQAWPVFDEDRLETSIQGLSSRAEVESTKSETIDR